MVIYIKLIIQRMYLLFLPLLVFSMTTQPQFKDCNASRFDFFSQYALGKQNQLNSTFSILNSNIGILPNITYNSTEPVYHYTISETKTHFYYRDSQQKAEIVGNDIIYIKGGRVQASLNFTYYKNQSKGTGTAECLSDLISFAKLVYLQQAFIKFKVGDYTNISFYSIHCNITRVQPPLEPKDLTILQSLINANDDHNIKMYLQEQISTKYVEALNSSLYDEKHEISTQSQYTWIDPTEGKHNLTIKYTLLPVGCHLQSIGMVLNFVEQINGDQQWKCGTAIPASPRDTKDYGGIQNYYSLSIFQNTVRYAIQQKQLDTLLNHKNWQSNVFQFFAGDLYQLIPILTTKYYASQPVSGYCNASTTNLKVVESTNDQLLISMHYTCTLIIKDMVISEFEVDPNFIVKIQAHERRLDFRVTQVHKFAHFKDVGEYVLHDLQLANLFLIRSLERMLGERVFGSGWPLYARNYPAIQVDQGYLLVYDRVK